MDTVAAYAIAEAARARGDEGRVFDWHKAARLIREKNAKTAGAGLQGDWEWTGGDIFADGKPVPEDDTYTYLASCWAIPELEIDGELVDCFLLDSENTFGWHEKTYWPESALAILKGESQ